MTAHNITVLRQLKLNGMAQALLQQREQPGTYQALSFEERLQLLIDHEQQSRDNRKQQCLLTGATLKVAANAREIYYEQPRGLNQSVIAGLLSCGWVTGRCHPGQVNAQRPQAKTQRRIDAKSHIRVD